MLSPYRPIPSSRSLRLISPSIPNLFLQQSLPIHQQALQLRATGEQEQSVRLQGCMGAQNIIQQWSTELQAKNDAEAKFEMRSPDPSDLEAVRDFARQFKELQQLNGWVCEYALDLSPVNQPPQDYSIQGIGKRPDPARIAIQLDFAAMTTLDAQLSRCQENLSYMVESQSQTTESALNNIQSLLNQINAWLRADFEMMISLLRPL